MRHTTARSEHPAASFAVLLVAAWLHAGALAAGTLIVHGEDPAHVVPDRWIVTLQEEALAAIAARIDGRPGPALRPELRRRAMRERMTGLAAEHGVVLLGDPSPHIAVVAASREKAARLASDPEVRYVEQDLLRKPLAVEARPAPSYYLDRIDQRHLPLDGTYHHAAAGTGVRLYIIDTGVNPHPEFGDRLVPGRNFLDDQPPSDTSEAGLFSHGTAVAGIAAGTTFGVAGGATIVPLRAGTFVDLPVSLTIQASDFAIADCADHLGSACILNMSYGCVESSVAEREAAERAAVAGILQVGAAGNSPQPGCLFPAGYPEVFAVGGTDREDRWASSRHGPCIDLYAPADDLTAITSSPSQVVLVGGTSFSAPQVTGVAALLLEERPTLGPEALRGAIVSGSTKGVINGLPEGSHNRLLYSLLTGGCLGNGSTLCLHEGRFRVGVEWRDFAGRTGVGNLVPGHSADSGLFWFFGPSNWELLVKILDGCPENGHFWVFLAAATSVEYTVRVEDFVTGEVWEETNPLGRLAPARADTDAFNGCALP
jgi:hypothetical protein